MTFSELLAEARRLLGQNDDVSVAVEAWDYCDRFSPRHMKLGWRIWSAERKESFEGRSPEAALDALRISLADDLDAEKRIKDVAI
jgi:hypothetical protein